MDAFFVGLDALFRGDLMGTAGFTGETEEAPLVDGGPTGSSARVAGVLDQLG
ncbi:MAG: hypothetical protein Q8P27_02605 [Candidatus Peregrinibacteria bacterium]|nr:hypothetical protein [Candidatus Peregrinibacteria bacterium]